MATLIDGEELPAVRQPKLGMRLAAVLHALGRCRHDHSRLPGGGIDCSAHGRRWWANPRARWQLIAWNWRYGPPKGREVSLWCHWQLGDGPHYVAVYSR